MKLTNEQYNLINKITNKAKMDWLEIRTDDNGNDYIFDNEECETYSLLDGLLILNDCILDLDEYNLSEYEIKVYTQLTDFMITFDKLTKERLVTLLYNALTILEEANLNCMCLKKSKLQAEIGITNEEYDCIMSENPINNVDTNAENPAIAPAERRKI